jgi:Domain of unknown function (DUF4440)
MTNCAEITPALALQWEQQRRAALLAGDAEALAPLLSEALVYVHSTAVRDSKGTYLAKLRGGVLRYLSLEFTDLNADVSAGAVLVTGRMAATVLREGQEKQVKSVFLTVWLPERTDGSVAGETWRLRAHQGTPLPP